MYDVAIIGGGIVGCALSYRLSRCKIGTVLIEKENDICLGATRANSAIIHAGFDPKPDTLMAKLNVKGNEMCKEICEKLSVRYKQIGSLVVAFNDDEMATLKELLARGNESKVPGLEIISGDEVRRREPAVSKDVIGALYAPTAAIVNPWELGIAMAETAVRNGVKFQPSFPVTSIEKENDYYRIISNDKVIEAKYVVNAAGVFADKITAMVATPSYKIIPTAGEYFLLDKSEGQLVNTVIFPCPSKVGKGVLISPTVHGNLIVGPNAVVRDDGDDTSSTSEGLNEVRQKSTKTVNSINFRQNVRNFTGVRANSTVDDFIIDFCNDKFLDIAGIRSPGLSSAPAIADYAAMLLESAGLPLDEKNSYIDSRKCVHFNELTKEQKEELIKENPLYGRVICRCETITQGEIIDAVNSPIPPVSVDGIKRRAGAGMGRCQGGFCGPRVVDILAKELKISPEDVLQDRQGSYILVGQTKNGGRE